MYTYVDTESIPLALESCKLLQNLMWWSSDPPKEEMATYFSILAWKIPWTEESGGLQSIEAQRVGHD